MSDEKKPLAVAADVFDALALVAGQVGKTGGTVGTVSGIVGGLLELGALLARAFGTEAPLEVRRMRSSLAEKLMREAEARALARKEGVL